VCSVRFYTRIYRSAGGASGPRTVRTSRFRSAFLLALSSFFFFPTTTITAVTACPAPVPNVFYFSGVVRFAYSQLLLPRPLRQCRFACRIAFGRGKWEEALALGSRFCVV